MQIFFDLLFFSLAFLIDPLAYFVLFVVIIIAIYWYRKILIWVPFITGFLAILLLAIERVFRFNDLSSNFYDVLYHVTSMPILSAIVLTIAGLIISKKQDKKTDYKFLRYFVLYLLLIVAMFIINSDYLTYIP